MDLVVTLAVLCAALVHATWNAFVKKGADHLITITGVSLGSAICALIVFPFVHAPQVQSWPYIAASVVLHVAYMIALSQAYRYSDFSSAYPIARGTAPILIFAWSILFLNESLSSKELLAVSGIIIGILVFTTRRLNALVSDRRSITYALLTAFFIAAYTLVDGIGARKSVHVNGYIVWMEAFSAIPLLIYTYYKRGSGLFYTLSQDFRYLFLAGLMSLASYWVVVWAMTQAPIALVSALRETSIIIAALIGAFYFKEPSGKRRIIAAVIVCISVVILRL